jgi:hypothetical protein
MAPPFVPNAQYFPLPMMPPAMNFYPNIQPYQEPPQIDTEM